jgi:hypothetical protein
MTQNISTPAQKPMPAIRSGKVGIALVLLAALCWHFYSYTPFVSLGFDESVYRLYVQTFEKSGVQGIRAVIQAWPTDEQLSKGPLPYRFLFILLGSWADNLLGGETSANLAKMSLAFGIGTILVTALLIGRWFGTTTGLLTAALMVFSPLATALSHRALQDTSMAFLMLTSIFFYDRYWREGAHHDLLLFGAALSACFLTKESALFLYPSFFLAACYHAQNTDWRSRIFILAPLAFAPALAFGIICWLSGDIETCLNTYRIYIAMQRTIPYTLQYQAGPWFRYLVDFMLLSPATFLLALIGVAGQSADFQSAKAKYTALIYLLSALTVFSLLPLMNIRLVLFLDVFVRLFAVLGIYTLCKQLPLKQHLSIYIGVMVATVIAIDVIQFNSIFEVSKVYDPVTAELIRGNGLVRSMAGKLPGMH